MKCMAPFMSSGLRPGAIAGCVGWTYRHAGRERGIGSQLVLVRAEVGHDREPRSRLAVEVSNRLRVCTFDNLVTSRMVRRFCKVQQMGDPGDGAEFVSKSTT